MTWVVLSITLWYLALAGHSPTWHDCTHACIKIILYHSALCTILHIYWNSGMSVRGFTAPIPVSRGCTVVLSVLCCLVSAPEIWWGQHSASESTQLPGTVTKLIPCNSVNSRHSLALSLRLLLTEQQFAVLAADQIWTRTRRSRQRIFPNIDKDWDKVISSDCKIDSVLLLCHNTIHNVITEQCSRVWMIMCFHTTFSHYSVEIK